MSHVNKISQVVFDRDTGYTTQTLDQPRQLSLANVSAASSSAYKVRIKRALNHRRETLTPRFICSKIASPPWSKSRSKKTAPTMMVMAKVDVLLKSRLQTDLASAMLVDRSSAQDRKLTSLIVCFRFICYLVEGDLFLFFHVKNNVTVFTSSPKQTLQRKSACFRQWFVLVDVYIQYNVLHTYLTHVFIDTTLILSMYANVNNPDSTTLPTNIQGSQLTAAPLIYPRTYLFVYMLSKIINRFVPFTSSQH